tara:strand:+ start:315 stop:485 length:171 start_codon:yes stop_codon:yes gene_type:complete
LHIARSYTTIVVFGFRRIEEESIQKTQAVGAGNKDYKELVSKFQAVTGRGITKRQF